jgi:bifunctional DNase/RNase
MSMVPVQIAGLQLNSSDASVIVLAERTNGGRALPIVIGPAEAMSIAMAVSGVEPERPGTHDLFAATLAEVGAKLEEIVITELTDNTFHAELFLESSRGLGRVSARPSDAIALAVRTGAAIFVNAAVLQEAGVAIELGDDEPLSDDEIDDVVEQFGDWLRTAQPEDITAPTTTNDDEGST